MAVLEGITVLDLSRLIAGPYATMVLADLGARVIKVESLTGEDGRHFGPPFYGDVSVTFMTCNRGKESISFDVRTPAGKEILARLLRRSQVVVHNFRPDFVEQHGLGYEELRRVNPEIIYYAVTSYGETGPYRLKPAVDSVIQGVAGAFYACGEEQDPPIRIGLPIVDISAGMCGATGLLAAIMEYQKTGRGQRVELTLIDTMLNFLAGKIGETAVEGRPPLREINLPIAVPSRHFRAADGAYFSVSVVNNGAFKRFCKVIGRPEWIEDSRFSGNPGRIANRKTLLAELATIFATRPAQEWVAAFDAADIPTGPVNTVPQMLQDPVLRGRLVEHPQVPGLPAIGFPAQLSQGMLKIEDMPPPPRMGQHTTAILKEVGYGDHEVARLVAQGAVKASG